MPIEVRELVIRAVVEGDRSPQRESDSPVQREEIVTECVEQVLEILKNRQER